MITPIQAKIERLSYTPGTTMQSIPLSRYAIDSFDINTAKASGIVELDDKNAIAYSKWVTPKRTRSYPFARIYDTYSFGGKRVTIIPVIKDEGLGSNNDRINFITLSWMNLMNVYVILAWYEGADRKGDDLITNQRFNADYVNKKLQEIREFQLDAHHWNNEHFINEFATVFRAAVTAYENIRTTLGVALHNSKDHLTLLERITDSNGQLSLEAFGIVTLTNSQLAAVREVGVNHKNEHLGLEGEKMAFEIRNNLGGTYYLTADELLIDPVAKTLLIQEAKNSTKDKLPKLADIKDGLFKILLFSQIDTLSIRNEKYVYSVSLRLTGSLASSIVLPKSDMELSAYCAEESLTKSESQSLQLLNEEAAANGYRVVVEGNHA